MDRMPENGEGDSSSSWRINVLVFDVLSYGGQSFRGEGSVSSASARYALLRSLEDNFSNGVFVSENMKVQWAGRLDALRQFRDSSAAAGLPHIMECFVRLGTMDPCEMGLVMEEI